MTRRPIPQPPKPGEVVRYAYLWREEANRGLDEGRKDRPCAVVLAMQRGGSRTTVIVAPITHAEPVTLTHAVEMPAETKRRLGLDEARSWIITTELNAFTWPGPDIRPVAGSDDNRRFTYGSLPSALTRRVVELVLASMRDRRTKTLHRDEPPPSRGNPPPA